MSITQEQLSAARQRLDVATKILLVSHVRPDGDAICSLLGMGLALEAKGKQVQMLLNDGTMSGFKHLEGNDRIARKVEGKPDVVIAVDAAAQDRMGDAVTDLTVDICIDHHVTNTRFGEINLIDEESVATCAILAEHFPALGLEISPSVAEALLTGILTDTIGFRTSNMSPKALRIAADLMEKGANLPDLYQNGLMTRSFEAMRYWGAGLSSLQREGQMVWATLSMEDRKAAKYPGNDDAELVNNLSVINDASITVLFIEQSREEVKISWRSRGQHDVSKVAAQFGGGGHKAAAGASVQGSLEAVTKQVLAATKESLGV